MTVEIDTKVGDWHMTLEREYHRLYQGQTLGWCRKICRITEEHNDRFWYTGEDGREHYGHYATTISEPVFTGLRVGTMLEYRV